MSAHLFPCPGCNRNAVADDGHAICRECEGKPVIADPRVAVLERQVATLREALEDVLEAQWDFPTDMSPRPLEWGSTFVRARAALAGVGRPTGDEQ